MPTTKDETTPTSNEKLRSTVLPEIPSSLTKPEPNIIGKESKKEKRAASERVSPKIRPPEIVAPLLDVPGKRARAAQGAARGISLFARVGHILLEEAD